MIKSMTGYGRAFGTANDREITVEIKAVNHRYYEVYTRVPRSFAFLEDRIKSHLQTGVSRGKIEVGVQIVNRGTTDSVIEPNLAVARGYYDALCKIAEELGLKSEASVSSVARFSDVFTVTNQTPNEDALWQDVLAVLTEAMDNFQNMRVAEGEKLKADMLSRLASIEDLVCRVEENSAPRLEAYREKLLQRMQKALEGREIDENRVLLEAALYADKSAVDEETVRLKSHVGQFREILESGEPVGRKLDFLIQEFNREANTIGSKANDLAITSIVVDLKSEIEKIREQIQNVE